jgi:hypothetical protein
MLVVYIVFSCFRFEPSLDPGVRNWELALSLDLDSAALWPACVHALGFIDYSRFGVRLLSRLWIESDRGFYLHAPREVDF